MHFSTLPAKLYTNSVKAFVDRAQRTYKTDTKSIPSLSNDASYEQIVDYITQVLLSSFEIDQSIALDSARKWPRAAGSSTLWTLSLKDHRELFGDNLDWPCGLKPVVSQTMTRMCCSNP